MTDLTTCPDCGAGAEILDRFVLESTHGPVEHVRTTCVNRHCFVLPAASMPCIPSCTGRDAGVGGRPQPR